MNSDARDIPTRLAEFEIIRRLGVGGMAEVFLAKKRGAEGTYKVLVVKRVLPSHGSSRRFRAMFAEEAQLATRLNHPNIVQVYEFQDYGDEGQLLSMEYVEGPDLRRLSRAARAKEVRLPPYVAAYIVGEVAKGLHYAHERKDEGGTPLDIVHRDVSPQNILLSYEGGVKIADFGIASANLFREEPGVLKGKTAFMSPEQARGERVDRRTDIYSLGVVFHELLAGRPLHTLEDEKELLQAVRSGQVEPPSTFARGVPGDLEAIVMRALERDPEARFQTARDLATAVTRALFHKQEVVDSHVLENIIAEFVGAERVPLDAVQGGVGSQHGSSHGSESVLGPTIGTGEDTGVGQGHHVARGRSAGKEVRHVAVIQLAFHGLEALVEAAGRAAAAQALDQLRSTIEEIAFKRNARLSWQQAAPGDLKTQMQLARVVVGLSANPARAAADSVWFAVDVHEVISAASGDLPVKLRVGIGIVRGIAVGERDKAGNLIHHTLRPPAFYLAELLSREAGAGVSLVAGGLYRLVRKDFLWGDAPTIDIPDAERRSLPRNMRIYSLLRPLTREEKLQEMALAPTDLIGRDAELADLHAGYYSVVGAGAVQGQATARVVSGEMGIGKTALVSSFLSELPPDARILRVECSPAKSEVPLATINEFVRELTGTKPGQALDQARQLIADALDSYATERDGAEIVNRLAELSTGRVASVMSEADDVHNRYLITTGLSRFFARAASQAPLVVLVDGLQWCDRASLELISELVRNFGALPLFTILVTRPEERVDPYVRGLVRIEIKGLSSDNQIRLLQARLGVGASVAQVCADLLPRAAGNPFFLLEMVDALLERGLLEIREGAGNSHELVRVERQEDSLDGLPSTLEQLIADRLSELPDTEQSIVDWLSVAGGPLSDTDLSALNGDQSAEAVARLCARGLCDHHEQIVDVRHPLTRDVAYRMLGREQRARMHAALGVYLAKTPLGKGLTAAVVARHLARGDRRPEAAKLYLEAAQAARANYQTRLATRCYRRAIALLDDDDLRLLEAHEAMEAICRNRGRWRERRKHLRALRQLAKQSGKPFWVATALIDTARFEFDAGHLAKALSSAQRAEHVSSSADAPFIAVEAQALTSEILRDLGDMQGALAAVDRALNTASGSDVSVRLRAEVLRSRGTLLRRMGRVHESVQAHAEAIAVFKKVGARRLEAQAKSSLAFAMYVLGKFEDGVALALDSIGIDLAIGGRFQIAKTLSNIGQCYAGLGDLERGLAYLKRAREAHERYGDQDSRADTLLATAEVLIEAGDRSGAQVLVGDAGALTQVTGSAYDSIHEKILRAVLARIDGDSSTAVMKAFDARQAAEAQAYVAFHFYAMAVEAVARVEVGEVHTGILLATTAMGAIETLQGSEYGLQTRSLCCEALRRAGSPQADEMRTRAGKYASALLEGIRDRQFRAMFVNRIPVAEVLSEQRPSERSEP